MTINKQMMEFVDSFWPLDDIHRALPTSYALHLEYLRKHFDPQIIDRLDTIVKQRDEIMKRGGSGHDEYQQVTNIVFENRLHDVWCPSAIVGSRIALGLLLQELCSVQKPFSILDMGCGSGMVDIGLALRLPQLQHVYAVDRGAEALDVFRENIDAHIPERRDMFTFLNHDYKSQSFQSVFKEVEPLGVPYILSVFPFSSRDTLDFFPHFMSVDGNILCCASVYKDNDEFSWDEYLDAWQSGDRPYAFHNYGLDWRYVNYSEMSPKMVVELIKITQVI